MKKLPGGTQIHTSYSCQSSLWSTRSYSQWAAVLQVIE